MRFIRRLFSRLRHGDPGEVPQPEVTISQGMRSRDPWFWSHYEVVANIVMAEVPAEALSQGRKIVDFGCGDGAATLGIASHVAAQVIGVDLAKSFNELPRLAERNLGARAVPGNLSFEQNHLGQPLPFADNSIDLVYSWSVLEHVADVDEVLREFSRVIRARGYLFIQIDPLFHSPYGSHLQRLIDVPWAHLLYDEPEFIRLALNATDKVPLDQQDTLYRNHVFDDVKRYLISEYRRLNRIRADQLIELVSASGFDLLSTKLIEAENVCPDSRLLQLYPRDLLMTQQVVLLGQKKGPPPTVGPAASAHASDRRASPI